MSKCIVILLSNYYRYQKILCFRLFKRKIYERKEARHYGRKLNQFALELYKRRSFSYFFEKVQQKKIERETVHKSQQQFLLYRKKKAFMELKATLIPRVNYIKDNLKAMKLYILNLYGFTFDHWIAYVDKKNQLKQISEKIEANILLHMKEKFINKLYQRKKAKVNKAKIFDIVSKRLMRLKGKQTIRAWREITVFRRTLKIAEQIYHHQRNHQILKIYFSKWLESYCEGTNKKQALAKMLVKIYKRSVEQGFASLAVHYARKKKLDLCFDRIYEKYITRLLKTHFDAWSNFVVFRTLGSDSLDEGL